MIMHSLRKCILYLPISLVASLCLWFLGFVYFIVLLSKEQHNQTHVVDGIVVLTGGQGRIAEGISLFQKGLGKKLFISGVHKGVNAKMLLKKQSVPSQLQNLLTDEHLGYDAKNTIENAKEIASWVKNNNIHSIRLVTADYHLQRSLLELLSFVPNLDVISHPVKTIYGINRNTLSILWREYIKLSIRYYIKFFH